MRGATLTSSAIIIPPLSFQPTRPVRGATRNPYGLTFVFGNFNPRAPCGARLMNAMIDSLSQNFNPRAPCGARHFPCPRLTQFAQFQPTRPVRGATGAVSRNVNPFRFQPTRPVRGATGDSYILAANHRFQPTRPVRGATTKKASGIKIRVISTHAPRAGRDVETQ